MAELLMPLLACQKQACQDERLPYTSPPARYMEQELQSFGLKQTRSFGLTRIEENQLGSCKIQGSTVTAFSHSNEISP